jgi:2-oxoisovalerate dehydrogenase E2 component (dihydrolipoyl transacylase)
MADIKTFYLPDLGEGLPDATVVEWHVKEGDTIKLDAPLCSMETAKAVVDVPSPYTGKVTKLHGAAGDIIETGAALAEFEPDPNAKQRAEAESTGHHHGPKKSVGSPAPLRPKKVTASDEGGEIDRMARRRSRRRRHRGRRDGQRQPRARRTGRQRRWREGCAGRARAGEEAQGRSHPRAPSGADGVVTLKDVKDAAANGSAALGAAPSRAVPSSAGRHLAPELPQPEAARTPTSLAGKPVRTAPPACKPAASRSS